MFGVGRGGTCVSENPRVRPGLNMVTAYMYSVCASGVSAMELGDKLVCYGEER